MSIDRQKLLDALVGNEVPPRVYEAVAARVHHADEDELAAALRASEAGEPDTGERDAAGYVAIVEAARAVVIHVAPARGVHSVDRGENAAPDGRVRECQDAAADFLVGEFARWSS